MQVEDDEISCLSGGMGTKRIAAQADPAVLSDHQLHGEASCRKSACSAPDTGRQRALTAWRDNDIMRCRTIVGGKARLKAGIKQSWHAGQLVQSQEASSRARHSLKIQLFPPNSVDRRTPADSDFIRAGRKPTNPEGQQ